MIHYIIKILNLSFYSRRLKHLRFTFVFLQHCAHKIVFKPGKLQGLSDTLMYYSFLILSLNLTDVFPGNEVCISFIYLFMSFIGHIKIGYYKNKTEIQGAK